MQNSFFILLFITILTVSSVDTAFAANIDLHGQMVMVGVWHGEEVSAKHGESWLALLETSSGFELQEVTLSVEIVVEKSSTFRRLKPARRFLCLKVLSRWSCCAAFHS